jgi:adenylate kinase
MAAGKLVSDEITNRVVEERLAQPDAQKGVIFDGYPRTPDQAEWLEKHLATKDERIAVVLVLELDLYDAFRRAFGRVTSAGGESYNIYSNAEAIDWKFVDHPEKAYPPRLEATLKATGEALIRRPDDASAHAIITRIDTYRAATEPLVKYYEAKGLLRRVDASKSIPEVSEALRKVIDTAAS